MSAGRLDNESNSSGGTTRLAREWPALPPVQEDTLNLKTTFRVGKGPVAFGRSCGEMMPNDKSSGTAAGKGGAS